MRVFKLRQFAKWAKKVGLADNALVSLVNSEVRTSLGANIYKQRVALKGRGKRGGARVILALRSMDKAFFLFGYGKNELANISEKQLEQLKILASTFLSCNEEGLEIALQGKVIVEVSYHE